MENPLNSSTNSLNQHRFFISVEPQSKVGRYRETVEETGYVARVLEESPARVTPIANDTVRTVKKAMVLYTSG